MNLKEKYRAICQKYTDVPLFLQDWWMDIVCPDWDVAIEMNGDNVAGVWPYNKESKLGVSLLRTPKLTPYQGPYVSYPKDLKQVNRDGFENDTIAALLKQLPDVKVWNIATLPGIKQAGLFKHAGLEISTKQTFLIDLRQDEQVLLSNMKESLRRNIKAATDFEIVNDSSLLPQLYQYQKHTLSAKEVMQSHSLADMQNLMDGCMQRNCASLWAAKKGNEVLAIVWNVWDAEHSYYFMGAQKPGNDNYKAMPALLWHCIKEAKARGNSIFDLEGSMDPGVEKFFRSFGATRELYLVLKKNNSLLWKVKEKLRG
ncbi:MAG: GNAT family N-acetyltransferase [Bacteroidetes bacterium]|nr:GNAT family N-acetyltransferase [Bacteroidota bacterium]